MTEQYTQDELPFEGGLPPASKFDLKALNGCAVLIAIGGCHPDMPTRYGVRAAVRANVVVLNGPDAGKEYIDVLFFGKQAVSRLREVAGKAYPAHVSMNYNSTTPAAELDDPSTDEYELALKWHAENPGRKDQLVTIAVSAFNNSKVSNQQQPMQSLPPRSTPPPTGPNYGRSGPPPAPLSQPPVTTPPTAAGSATMASVRGEFEPMPAATHEAPF